MTDIKYTINGKEYSQFDINKRCAELMGSTINNPHPNAKILIRLKDSVVADFGVVNYCNNPSDTWSIIEKIWDELMVVTRSFICDFTQWDDLIEKHNCSKLVAACICFIEGSDCE